jgi:predicted ATP-grasp superfamily ATP-dependent carboligase
MKAAKTLVESLAHVEQVTTQGDLRRIVANSLLALARKEISATDVEAMAKGLDAISNSLNAEIKVAKTSIELREKGAQLGHVVQLGQLVIDGGRNAT